MAEKEYVLGNKAKDLYQYTRQVTKPGADEKVDARDVAAVMRKWPQRERWRKCGVH